uniref:Uncharacterized protein n=1 Tax=Mycena chlorophos TaxID=658473 RepID=A0ABQ0LPY2_MYCCL|nr:predicted protein [Mycena chlorophos]
MSESLRFNGSVDWLIEERIPPGDVLEECCRDLVPSTELLNIVGALVAESFGHGTLSRITILRLIVSSVLHLSGRRVLDLPPIASGKWVSFSTSIEFATISHTLASFE